MAQVEVLAEDQKRINKFGNLNSQVTALKLELESLEKTKKDIEASKEELELLEGMEDIIPYKLGGVFIELPFDDCVKQVDADLEETENKCQVLKQQIDIRLDEMKVLRTLLYEKFGRENINLGD